MLNFEHHQPLPSLCVILRAVHTEADLGLAYKPSEQCCLVNQKYNKAMCSPIKLKVNCYSKQ